MTSSYGETTFRVSETQHVQGNYDDILSGLKNNCEFFVNFFLHEQITYGVPDFHIKIWSLMIGGDFLRIAMAVPRGHAKTTLAKLSAVWYFLFSDVRFIVYVSNTNQVATDAVKDIIGFMECDNFKSMFGELDWEKRNEGDGTYIFKLGDKRCILRARGLGQQLRGINVDNMRPQYAIVDDLEDSSENQTDLAQRQRDTWFFGTFIKCLDPFWNKVVYIGNLTSNTCLLRKLLELSSWHSMRMGCLLSNGTPLWPQIWPIDKLIEDYKTYVELGLVHLWMAEMMNLVMVGDNALIKPEEIYYRVPVTPDECIACFITIDPSTGFGNDSSGIVVHGLVPDQFGNNIPQAVDYVLGKFDEGQLFKETLELMQKWNCTVVGLESISFQRILKTLFEILFLQAGVTQYTLLPLTPGRVSKPERLRGLCGIIKQKGYALTFGDVEATTQLLEFDILKQQNVDDLIDSIAYGPKMLELYYHLIMVSAIRESNDVAVTRQEDLYGG